jgi:hypothetical protein
MLEYLVSLPVVFLWYHLVSLTVVLDDTTKIKPRVRKDTPTSTQQ